MQTSVETTILQSWQPNTTNNTTDKYFEGETENYFPFAEKLPENALLQKALTIIFNLTNRLGITLLL